MIHESILRYRRGRFLWWAVLLVVLSTLLYTTQGGSQPPNGGTWQGYVLGTLGALLIVWLAMLGVRKRQYSSAVGTVPAWTSAHVYLGTALLVVATLHSAGQLGWNVHSLSYVLMFVVIVSGFYGIYTYINYPQAMMSNRSNASRAEMFAELFELDNRGRELAVRVPEDINVAVTSAIERTAIGGGIYSQLLGRDQSLFVPPGGSGKTASNRDQQPVIDVVAERVPRASKVAEAELLEALLEVFCRRQAVLRRIALDIRLRGRIRFWLLIHVPLTIALLVALVVHIVTTFIYW